MMEFADRLDVLCDQGPFPAAGETACAGVCVGGRYTRSAVRSYTQTDVRVSTLIDWPSGLGKPTVRQIEAVAAGKDGTHAVELMAHPGHLSRREFEALRDDLLGVTIAVREVSRAIVVNVVLDRGALGDDAQAIEYACLAVRESGGDGVVAAGRRGPMDLDYEKYVATLAHHAGPLSVKAMLTSMDAEQARVMFEAGVDRVGVSSGILFG